MLYIKEVQNKKDLKKFVKFPYKLFANNPYYIPVLISDEINEFTPSKNDAFSYCDSRQFICYRDKKIVGRIATILNHRYNEKKGFNQIRFTRFDTIDDLEVTKTLFDKVKEVAKENGCNEIIGPVGFCDLDKQGMLVEGYDRLGMYITPYNFPYYNDHLQKLGFNKDADWVEYRITLPQAVDPRLEDISKYVMKKFDLHLLELKSVNDVVALFGDGLKLMNEVYSHLYGYVELTDKQITDFAQYMKSIIVLDYVCAIVDKNNNLVGYGFVAPAIGKAFQKSYGHMTVGTIIKLIKALSKNDTVDMYSVGVKHEYQNTGVNAIILNEILKGCVKNGIRYAETGPELESNCQVQSQWRDYEKEQHKRRRSYKLILNEENE